MTSQTKKRPSTCHDSDGFCNTTAPSFGKKCSLYGIKTYLQICKGELQ